MTYIVDPSLAFLRQWASPEREDRVVELEIMRKEAEEIDESAHLSADDP